MTSMQAPEAITRYILDTFERTAVQVNEEFGASFFFYGEERMFPFATIVTRDNEFDAFSNLDRPHVSRLNIGVSKSTFGTLFGPPSAEDEGPPMDYTVLDQLMPHPVYAQQLWVSVLNPGAETWLRVQELLAEAYEREVKKAEKKRERAEQLGHARS